MRNIRKFSLGILFLAYRVLPSVWRALAISWYEWILYLSLKVLGAKCMFTKTLMIWEWCGMKALGIDMIWRVRLIVPVDRQRPCACSWHSLEKIQGDWKPWWGKKKKKKFLFPKLLAWVRQKEIAFSSDKRKYADLHVSEDNNCIVSGQLKAIDVQTFLQSVI